MRRRHRRLEPGDALSPEALGRPRGGGRPRRVHPRAPRRRLARGGRAGRGGGAAKRRAYGARFMTDLAEEYGCIGIQLGAQYTGSATVVNDGS